LAQRFAWLQQGIEVFGLFNKIEFTQGADLDDHFGQLYDLPRLTGESDTEYRLRLQTYAKVLVGSGTTPNVEEVLGVLIDEPGGATVTSIWPAQALIEFNSIEAMRKARSRQTLINSVLPGMFAAGVDYRLQIHYLDSLIRAAIKGDATMNAPHRAAIAQDQSMSYPIRSLVSYLRSINVIARAAIQTELQLDFPVSAFVQGSLELDSPIRAAIHGTPSINVAQRAAVKGSRLVSVANRAAIMAQPSLVCPMRSAISKPFEIEYSIRAVCGLLGSMTVKARAAVQAGQSMSYPIRAWIARGAT
jgi:hypothetical protein